MRGRRLLLSMLLSFPLALPGCSIVGADKTPQTAYVLLPESTSAIAECERTDKESSVVLLIEDTAAPSYLGGTRIPFVKDDTVGFYQYAVWVEPLAERFNLLIQRRLECDGVVSMATRVSGWLRSDYILKTELQRLVHVTEPKPGRAEFRLRAELIEGASSRSVGYKDISSDEPLSEFDAQAAVAAMSSAVTTGLSELSDWVKEKVDSR